MNRKSEKLDKSLPLSLHGLAHSVHDFGVTGRLRRSHVSVRPGLSDKDKTTHSSRRSRQMGKMLVVLWCGRTLFGVVPRYGAISYTRSLSILCSGTRVMAPTTPSISLAVPFSEPQA